MYIYIAMVYGYVYSSVNVVTYIEFYICIYVYMYI